MMPNIWEEAKSINEDMLTEDAVIKEAEKNFKEYAKTIPHISVLPKEWYNPEDDIYDELYGDDFQ